MVKRFISAALSVLVTLPVSVALASGTDSITVNRPTVSVCNGGANTISVTINATYSESTQHVVVTFDGTQVWGPDTDEPATITLNPIVTGSGNHTIVATIYDTSALDDPVAQHVYNFEIDCHQSPAFYVLDDQNRGLLGYDQPTHGGTDCCPGHDNGSGGSSSEEHVSVVAKTTVGQVKGATTHTMHVSNPLKRLNSIFRSVFGRTPTYTEWNYWASRLLHDKKQLDALYGAMQWHKLRGHTIGA